MLAKWVWGTQDQTRKSKFKGALTSHITNTEVYVLVVLFSKMFACGYREQNEPTRLCVRQLVDYEEACHFDFRLHLQLYTFNELPQVVQSLYELETASGRCIVPFLPRKLVSAWDL